MEAPGERLLLKLWETLAEKGVGGLLRPWQIEREGRALNAVEHDKLLMLARAERETADIRAGLTPITDFASSRGVKLLSSPTRSNERDRKEPELSLPPLAVVDAVTYADGMRREINSARAVLFAEQELAFDSSTPPDKSIDEDWLYTWRENAGRVSVDTLQRLWGKVLAGELRAPGSHSLRTLDFLKGLSADEANLISRVASFVISGVINRDQTDYLASKGVSFDDLLYLQEIGVLSGVESIGLTMTFGSMTPFNFMALIGGIERKLVVTHADRSNPLTLGIYKVTKLGLEVLSIGKFQIDEEYINKVGQLIKSKGYDVVLGYWEATETGYVLKDPKNL